MQGFMDALNNFLSELRNNILQTLSDNNNTEYRKMKEEKEECFEQLQGVAPLNLLNDYIDAQYALVNFESNYCYLCGMRDHNSPDAVSVTAETMPQEYFKNKRYRQLQAQASERYNELQATLPPERFSLLTQYIKKWDTISDLEKHYLYSGGMNDKAQLNKQFNLAYEKEWKKLTDTFL